VVCARQARPPVHGVPPDHQPADLGWLRRRSVRGQSQCRRPRLTDDDQRRPETLEVRQPVQVDEPAARRDRPGDERPRLIGLGAAVVLKRKGESPGARRASGQQVGQVQRLHRATIEQPHVVARDADRDIVAHVVAEQHTRLKPRRATRIAPVRRTSAVLPAHRRRRRHNLPPGEDARDTRHAVGAARHAAGAAACACPGAARGQQQRGRRDRRERGTDPAQSSHTARTGKLPRSCGMQIPEARIVQGCMDGAQ